MPAVSKKQQRFMGMVHAAQKGELRNPSKKVKKAARSMSYQDARDFASTPRKNLPLKKTAMRLYLHEYLAKHAMEKGADYFWSSLFSANPTFGMAGDVSAAMDFPATLTSALKKKDILTKKPVDYKLFRDREYAKSLYGIGRSSEISKHLYGNLDFSAGFDKPRKKEVIKKRLEKILRTNVPEDNVKSYSGRYSPNIKKVLSSNLSSFLEKLKKNPEVAGAVLGLLIGGGVGVGFGDDISDIVMSTGLGTGLGAGLGNIYRAKYLT